MIPGIQIIGLDMVRSILRTFLDGQISDSVEMAPTKNPMLEGFMTSYFCIPHILTFHSIKFIFELSNLRERSVLDDIASINFLFLPSSIECTSFHISISD